MATFSIYTNSSWSKTFQITSNGVPVNLNGMTMKSDFRPFPGSPTLIASLTTGSGTGITIVDAVNGYFSLTLTATQTAGCVNYSTVSFDVLLTNGNNAPSFLVGGKVPVKRGVTIYP